MCKKRNILFVLVISVISSVVAYNSICKSSPLSDTFLENVEALASYESNSDCSGCYTTHLAFCKDWGWGGCIGDKYIHYA